ncbi:MAG: DUF222 domain-containing protein [Actinomycetota bacterium]
MDQAPDEALHDQQTDALEQLSALRATVDAQILKIIRAADESRVWMVDGSPSLVEWVAWRCRLARSEARRQVAVASALGALPAIAAALDEGALSLTQVCILVDFVAPDGDAEWAERARGMHVEQLRAWRRSLRRVTAEEADEDHDRRKLLWWWDPQSRFLKISGRLPAEQGAVVDKALSRLAEAMPKSPEGTYETLERRGADALVELAGTLVAEDQDPDRATIVVHVEASALVGDGGGAMIEGGCELAPETVRRLACDCSLQVVVNDDGGRSLGVGRKTRTPPPWLRRLVVKRDGCCRFPGCERRRFVHTHHVRHWTPHEGPTQLDNLILLCRHHHRLVHEGGWGIRGAPDGEIVFVRPDGRDYVPERPRLRDDIRERILGPREPAAPGAVPSAMDLCLEAAREAPAVGARSMLSRPMGGE